MDTKQERIAIMRWEDETGPTEGKNRRLVKGTKASGAAKPGTSTDKHSTAQGKLQKPPKSS